MPRMHRITIPRPVSMGLRVLELVAGAVVMGVVGYYVAPYAQNKTWPDAPFIFALIWAAAAIVVSVLLLVPSMAHKVPWLGDFILSIGWWAIFGLILNAIDCGPFFSTKLDDGGFCRNWKAVEVFCFLSGIAWFVTGLFGIQFVQARRRGGGGGGRFR